MFSHRLALYLLQLLLGIVFVCTLTLHSTHATAQSGGEKSFAFLNLPISPRLAALGGKAPALINLPEPSLAVYNPALASEELHMNIEAGFTLYYAGIKYNHAAYFHNLPQYGILGASMRQIWYGRFQERNEMGEHLGSFTAYDMAINMHYAFAPIESLSIGITVSPIISAIERYTAFALTADLGLLYQSTDKLFSAAILARNIGGSLKHYNPRQRERAPFELLAGVTVTLKHAPIRFIFTLQNLENWRLRHIAEESYYPVHGDGRGEAATVSLWKKIYSEALVHPLIGVEVTPSKYFYLQVGYNHKMQRDMHVEARRWISGLSYGAGLRIKRFALSYSRTHYHLHGATNHIALYLNLAPNGTTVPEIPLKMEETSHE